jgi:hypothetical protein
MKYGSLFLGLVFSGMAFANPAVNLWCQKVYKIAEPFAEGFYAMHTDESNIAESRALQSGQMIKLFSEQQSHLDLGGEVKISFGNTHEVIEYKQSRFVMHITNDLTSMSSYAKNVTRKEENNDKNREENISISYAGKTKIIPYRTPLNVHVVLDDSFGGRLMCELKSEPFKVELADRLAENFMRSEYKVLGENQETRKEIIADLHRNAGDVKIKLHYNFSTQTFDDAEVAASEK